MVAGNSRLRDAGIEIARFDPDLMAQIEELNREFTREQVGGPTKFFVALRRVIFRRTAHSHIGRILAA